MWSWPDEATFQMVLRPTGMTPSAVLPRPDRFLARAPVIVTLTQAAAGRDGVRWACSESDAPAGWVAVVLACILEEKTTLGLATEPPEEQDLPIGLLDIASLERRALAEREQRAREEKMRVTRVLFALVQKLDATGERVLIFPDAEERIGHALHRLRLQSLVADIGKIPAGILFARRF